MRCAAIQMRLSSRNGYGGEGVAQTILSAPLPLWTEGTMSSVTAEDLWDRIRGELVRIEDRLTTEISAVRGDLVRTEARLTTEISGVRGELDTLGVSLTTEVSAVRGELNTFRVGIEDRLTTEITAVRF